MLRDHPGRADTALVQALWDELSSTDPATGAPARVRTEGLIEVAAWNARAGGDVLGVVTVELAGVDDVAVRYGPTAADDVLRAATVRLRGRLRRGDVVGRLGATRFGVAVPGLAPGLATREIARIAGALAGAVGAPFVVRGEEIVLDVRVGTALCPPDADDVPALLARATAGETASLR